MSLPNESSFDPELWVPAPAFMRVKEFSERMVCSIEHILNLIRDGEIEVPVELQKSAPSGAAMRIPRASLVNFLRARSDLKAVAAANPKPTFNKKSTRRPAALPNDRKSGKQKAVKP